MAKEIYRNPSVTTQQTPSSENEDYTREIIFYRRGIGAGGLAYFTEKERGRLLSLLGVEPSS